MKIEWSRLAVEDREAIFDYIEQDNPHAALAVDESIEYQIGRLRQHPHYGRIGRIEGTRELVLTRLPYIVAYQINQDAILILRILHGAQLWPDELTTKI